jgi:sodium-dependent dicarboxylate transporter 2/3/5
MTETTPNPNRNVIVICLGLAVFALLLLMPLMEGITSQGQRMLAVAALMAIWWIGEGVPLAVTALLPVVLFPLLGIMPSKLVAPNYTNHLVFLFLGGFMIALAMEKWNFHKRVALVIISKIGDSPERIVLGFMVATAFLSMWISNTASTMMMLPVGMAVVRQIAAGASLDGEKSLETEKRIQTSLGLVLMLGLAHASSIGGVATLIGTPPNIVFAGFYKELFPDNPDITFFQWMQVGIPVVLIFLPVLWLFLCKVSSPEPLAKIKFPPNSDQIIKSELTQLGPMNRAEKFIGIVFLFAAFLWIFRKPLPLGNITIPGWSSLFSHSNFLHDSTVAMAMGLLLMIFPLGYSGKMPLKGKKELFVLDWKTAQAKLPWGILLLFGGGFALASGFKASGLDQWFGQILSGTASLPLWAVILTICLSLTFLTELTSNTATATMILPIIAAAAVAANYHPLMLMVPAAMSASFAFMMPVATPPNAIVFGSGWVTIPHMAKNGLVLNLFGAALITVVTLLLVQKILI